MTFALRRMVPVALRRAVRAAAAAGILPLGIAAQTPAERSTVAQFRGDGEHSGTYASSGPATFGGLQWRVQTAGPVRGSPTVSGATVYVGSADGHLYAIDVRSGDVRWRRSLGSPVSSTPAVANGLVYAGGLDGVMHALRAADGAPAWSVRTGQPARLRWGLESGETWTSSPNVAGDLVIFGARDGRVYAVEAATGRGRWTYDAGARVYSSPAVANGTVYVGAQDGHVHAIDLAGGARKWRFATEGAKLMSADFGFDRTTVQSSPAVAGGLVFVGARDGWHYAIDAATGSERWRVDHKVSWVNTSPAVSDGLVFVGSSDGHFVQAVDAATGVEQWRTPSVNIVWSSPAVDAERLYIGEGDGTLYALDKRTGKEVWRYRMGARTVSSPTLHDGRLFIGSDDGGIYAVNAAPAGAPSMRRAVFWDTAFVAAPLSRNRVTVRDYLRVRGYEVLDAAGLQRFLEERVRDRAPSVVVFSMDHLPATVAPVASDTVLFRRYLNAGGKAVWLGAPPLLAPLTAQGLKDLDRDAPRRLLGVSFEGGNFDPLGVAPNATGTALGLPAWYIDTWGANPRDVRTVWSLDEQGQAAAWIRSFGGPEGTGFVRFFAGDATPGRTQNHHSIQIVAELRPR